MAMLRYDAGFFIARLKHRYLMKSGTITHQPIVDLRKASSDSSERSW